MLRELLYGKFSSVEWNVETSSRIYVLQGSTSIIITASGDMEHRTLYQGKSPSIPYVCSIWSLFNSKSMSTS